MKSWLQKVFIPHESNGYAPHSLQKAAVLGMFFLILLSFTASNTLSLLWTNSQWMVSTILPAVIVDRTNHERGTESLGVLKRSKVLDEAARMKAEDMAKNQYFAHYSPAGVSPWYWFAQAKYNFIHAGENLAINFTDSDAIVKAWMASPTHRENIMNGNYTEIGIGTAKGKYQGYDTVYVVQLFGTPAQAQGVTPKPAVAGESISVPQELSEEVVTKTSSTTVLAQNVSITENTQRIQESVPTTSKEVVVANDLQTNGSSTVITGVETTTTTQKASEATIQAPTVLYSDFMSTSSKGLVAPSDPTTLVEESSAVRLFQSIVRSQLLLQMLYSVIALFVCISLALSIFIEIKHQQPVQIAYSFCLLIAMFGLFYLHVYLTSGVLIA